MNDEYMTESIDEILIKVFEEAEYSPLIFPRIELDRLFRDLTGLYTIGLSYGLGYVFKRAYSEDRNALRKALIAMLENSNSYFRGQISEYPSLQEDYKKKISKNNILIEKLEQLW